MMEVRERKRARQQARQKHQLTRPSANAQGEHAEGDSLGSLAINLDPTRLISRVPCCVTVVGSMTGEKNGDWFGWRVFGDGKAVK